MLSTPERMLILLGMLGMLVMLWHLVDEEKTW